MHCSSGCMHFIHLTFLPTHAKPLSVNRAHSHQKPHYTYHCTCTLPNLKYYCCTTVAKTQCAQALGDESKCASCCRYIDKGLGSEPVLSGERDEHVRLKETELSPCRYIHRKIRPNTENLMDTNSIRLSSKCVPGQRSGNRH